MRQVPHAVSAVPLVCQSARALTVFSYTFRHPSINSANRKSGVLLRFSTEYLLHTEAISLTNSSYFLSSSVLLTGSISFSAKLLIILFFSPIRDRWEAVVGVGRRLVTLVGRDRIELPPHLPSDARYHYATSRRYFSASNLSPIGCIKSGVLTANECVFIVLHTTSRSFDHGLTPKVPAPRPQYKRYIRADAWKRLQPSER